MRRKHLLTSCDQPHSVRLNISLAIRHETRFAAHAWHAFQNHVEKSSQQMRFPPSTTLPQHTRGQRLRTSWKNIRFPVVMALTDIRFIFDGYLVLNRSRWGWSHDVGKCFRRTNQAERLLGCSSFAQTLEKTSNSFNLTSVKNFAVQLNPFAPWILSRCYIIRACQ